MVGGSIPSASTIFQLLAFLATTVPPFRFDNTIREAGLANEVSDFVNVVGFSRLENRIQKLEQRMNENSFARYLLTERHQLEFSIWASANALSSHGRLPSVMSLQHNRAYAFIFVFNRVWSAVSPMARKKLLGSVINSFVDESDLNSLEHELKAIGHFNNLGAEIECHDLEEGGYDFLCSRLGQDFEVECKAVSVDKGRQIHQHDLLRLSDHLNQQIGSLAGQPDGFGTIVSVKLPSRLTRVPTTLRALAADIEQVFSSRERIDKDEWEISFHRFLISNSPFHSNQKIDKEATQDFVRQMAPGSTGQLLINAISGRRVAILDVHSAKPDEYIDRIRRDLKEGATQFSGTRPAVLVAAILDLSSHDLESIGRGGGSNAFQHIATRLLTSATRAHLHTVMFTGDAALRQKLDGSVNSSGTTLCFRNPNHPLREDSRLRLTLD